MNDLTIANFMCGVATGMLFVVMTLLLADKVPVDHTELAELRSLREAAALVESECELMAKLTCERMYEDDEVCEVIG